MSNGLYLNDNEIPRKNLAVNIEKMIESHQGQVVTSTLLDGSFHIQTVGKARLQVKCSCYATWENKTKITNCYFEGASVFVSYNGKRYYGKIEQEPSWDYVVNDETDNENKYFHSVIVVACSEVSNEVIDE